MPAPPRRVTLFPYTTLFRSDQVAVVELGGQYRRPEEVDIELHQRERRGDVEPLVQLEEAEVDLQEGEQLRRDLPGHVEHRQDRKSTRLNSSHLVISYAVFCL